MVIHDHYGTFYFGKKLIFQKFTIKIELEYEADDLWTRKHTTQGSIQILHTNWRNWWNFSSFFHNCIKINPQ